MDNRTVLAIGVLAAVVHAFAGIEFGAPFADGAVLQREMKVPVWGKMSPVDGKVPRKVRVEFAGQSKTSDVGKDGSWRVDLDPMAASKECRTMIVRALDSLGKYGSLPGRATWNVPCGAAERATGT